MFEVLLNPDNVPGKVTSGYQRQNTNMFALQTGLDTTEPYDNGAGTITIPAGGIIELNGLMFRITADITIQKPNAATAYWIAIGSGNAASDGRVPVNLECVTRPGAWNSAKQGCYLADGRRILNWVSLGELLEPPTIGAAWISPSVSGTRVKGKWALNLPKGWYFTRMAGGAGGGNGGAGTSSLAGAGGIANVNAAPVTYMFFHDGKKINIKVGGNGGAGSAGERTTNYPAGGGGGSGGGEETTLNEFSANGQIAGNGGNGYNYDTNYPAGDGGLAGNNGFDASSRMTAAGSASLRGRGGKSKTGAGGGGGAGGSNAVYRGGNGGDGGASGEEAADGQPGGYCDIYALKN